METLPDEDFAFQKQVLSLKHMALFSLNLVLLMYLNLSGI
jgi:hypothetical protein